MRMIMVANQQLTVTHSTGPDESESLEFWRGPGRTEKDLLVAFTFFEQSESPLLVHIPTEIPTALLTGTLDYCRNWVSKNLPETHLILS